jgi:hypothetical protein
MTGTLPAPPDPSVAPADSTPAEPAAQVASTEASPPVVSETATSGETPETRKDKTEKRFQELLADRADWRTRAQRLEQQLADLHAARTPTPDAQPSSSPAVVPLAQIIQRPDIGQPLLTDTDFYARYPEATAGDFTRYVTRYELVHDRQERARTDAITTRLTTYQTQVQAAVKDNPQFLESLHPRVASLMPAEVAISRGLPVTAEHVIGQAIITAADAPALMTHFSAHPDEIDRIAALGSEAQIVREIGRIEARLSTPPPASPSPQKTTSTAPPPSPPLGSRPAQPVNGKEAALAARDFLRYRAEANAEDAARVTTAH